MDRYCKFILFIIIIMLFCVVVVVNVYADVPQSAKDATKKDDPNT